MANEQTTEQKTEKRFSYNTIESALGTTGKLIPQAIPFEKAVLGALMIDKDAIMDIADFLRANMFYQEQHQYIYDAVHTLFRDNKPIDILTVTDYLRSEKKLEFVGGASYIASLTIQVASSANIVYHARIVMEKFVLRELINICNSSMKKAYDDPKDVLDLLDTAETELFNVVEKNFSRDSLELKTVIEKSLDEIIKMQSEKGFHGVPTGIRAIDEKIGGWQNSDLIIIAARPGMGKTSFVLSIARNAAIDFNKSVALFSLEMSASQLAHRLFAIESGINAEKISKGKLDEAEWAQLMDKISTLNTNKLIIDDTPALSIFDLRAKCRRLKHKYDIQLIIVDYLQLMQGGGDKDSRGKGIGNREQEISLISRSLKALAKDLNVPVIALSQLSRQVETRGGDHRPQLQDLRESGSIEQDADQVIFIYRPEYYKLETFSDGSPSAGRADIMIQKNRHGSIDDVRVRFISKYTKFTDDIESDFVSDFTHQGLAPNEEYVTLEAGFNTDSEQSDMPY